MILEKIYEFNKILYNKNKLEFIKYVIRYITNNNVPVVFNNISAAFIISVIYEQHLYERNI